MALVYGVGDPDSRSLSIRGVLNLNFSLPRTRPWGRYFLEQSSFVFEVGLLSSWRGRYMGSGGKEQARGMMAQ